MMTIQAVYREGSLRLAKRLPLPEGAMVEVQITPLEERDVTTTKMAPTLFGAFPELKALTAEDLIDAKRVWEHGLEKQARTLEGRHKS